MERKLNLQLGQEVATLAGGCFWGMEEIIREMPGVLDTEVGYTGGLTENPVYDTVKYGETGHAESIQIIFNPKVLSYSQLLHMFFRMHDPTTVDRQGNDRGSQYRSAIFFHSDDQKQVAESVIKEMQPKWGKPIVTQVVPARAFYVAEAAHQDYLQKYPQGYTCHWVRDI